MKKTFCLVLLGWVMVFGTAEARELQPNKDGGATPPLVLNDLNGKTHNLKDYRGQVVLINFWATWCPPCRAEMPSMQRLKEKMAGKPFVILAVDMGEPEDVVRSYIREIKTDFTVLMDKDGRALKAWKVFAFPTSYVIDEKGKIRYGLMGHIEWDEAGTVDKITGLLPSAAN